MPGSWEITQQNRVLCAILHTDITTIAWAFGLRGLILPGQLMGLTGMPFDHARNMAAMQTLDNGYEWLFFLDSDVVPPRDTILKLMAHNLPIVSGVYCRRSPPAGIPVMIRKGVWVTQYPANTLIEVDLVGAGCLLIHHSVLRKLPAQQHGHHWFDWRVDLQSILPRDDCVSEDFAFCQHARKHGYKIMVDTSIQCKHVGFAEAGHGTFGPLEAVPMG